MDPLRRHHSLGTIRSLPQKQDRPSGLHSPPQIAEAVELCDTLAQEPGGLPQRRTSTPSLVPTAVRLASALRHCWERSDQADPKWGAVGTTLLRLVEEVVRAEPAGCMEDDQFRAALHRARAALPECPSPTPARRSGARSADGIADVDRGPVSLTDGCAPPTLEAALAGIDLQPHAERMKALHPDRPLAWPEPLRTEHLLEAVKARDSPCPACTAYSLDSPLYSAANRAMREWDRAPEAFETWRGFAALLDAELQQLDRFVGPAYRAIDFRLPPTLYAPGAVVTWNQPATASSDPRVARGCLRAGPPSGTLFVIASATARPVGRYSAYPDEAEVLFRAGTQFQVTTPEAGAGVPRLLEAVLQCSLRDVEVVHLRELVLDSWLDLEAYLHPLEAARNRELLRFIRTLPAEAQAVDGATKRVAAPLSTMIRRASDGATALHMAVAVPDNLPCVQLVCARATLQDVTRENAQGLTALQVAVDRGHVDSAVYLMGRGVPWQQLRPPRLRRVLPWLARGADAALLRAVVCEAVRCAETGKKGEKAAARAALQQALWAACGGGGTAATVDVLLTAQADPTATDPDGGRTALMHAAATGNTAVVGDLLGRIRDAGGARAWLNWADGDGWTALMMAAEQGHAGVVQGLLGAGAGVPLSNAHGLTALALAARSGHAGVVTLLLEAKAFVHTEGGNGWTPLMFAAANGHCAALEALLEAGADCAKGCPVSGFDPLMAAARVGHAAALRALLRAKADVAATRSGGWTALSTAAKAGHVAAVRVLLGSGADVEAATVDGASPVLVAAAFGHAGVVQELVNTRANLEVADTGHRQTPLLHAAKNGHLGAVRSLVSARANLEAADAGGRTALVHARENGYAGIVHALLQAKETEGGKNPDVQDSNIAPPSDKATDDAVEQMDAASKV